MKQLGIKLPKEELDFLEWYSNRFAIPKATLYRDKTLQAFREWKTSFLLDEFFASRIGFKKFCNLATISFIEGMQFIQEDHREPLTPEILDDYTLELTEKNIAERNTSIFKNKESLIRSSRNLNEND
ncbi:MAG: hypothetical protein HeimC3_36080 [Candidatus Heimdallarchaeota archaeon LC_3]|nr:MAG: hypothetical protein HeimC3_36080 [Candidatus Heimdallarchaeota archaeon LC_3]